MHRRPRPLSRAVLIAGLSLTAVSAPLPAGAQSPAQLGEEQLLLVHEAMRVLDEVGDDLWRGWRRASKATLVIDTDREYLLNIPRGADAPEGFEPTRQRFMGSLVYSRPRMLTDLLRTALLLDDIPTAAVGAWRAEVESPNEWVVTLVEQWFHVFQLQQGEATKLAELGIAAEIMPAWQVDYPFPYDDPDVANAMLLLGDALYEFWSRSGTLPREGQRTFLAETAQAALANLRTVLTLKHGPEAWAYFRLLSWRDGVARYSGIVVAREIARAEVLDGYDQIDGFDDLPSRQTYAQTWEDHMRARFWMIRTSARDDERGRTTFHALGHGIAEMLDVVHPDWKRSYFERGVWLDDLVAEALERR